MKVDVKVDVKVNMKADENDLSTIQCIQKLEIKVAQYEQEKLRLKKKDKKIEQMKLHCQDHD